MWRRALAHAALRCADRALAASGGLAAALHIDWRSHVQHFSFRLASSFWLVVVWDNCSYTESCVFRYLGFAACFNMLDSSIG